jgi:hypothetical protein
MGAGCALVYACYSAAYSTIQDATGPALRGTAKALYSFATHALGASLGPARRFRIVQSGHRKKL